MDSWLFLIPPTITPTTDVSLNYLAHSIGFVLNSLHRLHYTYPAHHRRRDAQSLLNTLRLRLNSTRLSRRENASRLRLFRFSFPRYRFARDSVSHAPESDFPKSHPEALRALIRTTTTPIWRDAWRVDQACDATRHGALIGEANLGSFSICGIKCIAIEGGEIQWEENKPVTWSNGENFCWRKVESESERVKIIETANNRLADGGLKINILYFALIFSSVFG